MLEACRRAKIHRLVHTSTSEVFGRPVTCDRREASDQHASPYAASKHAADSWCKAMFALYGVRAVTVRPFTFGPRQSPRAVIPAIIEQALTSRAILLGNLAPRRDFTFVSDTVAGLSRRRGRSGRDRGRDQSGHRSRYSHRRIATTIRDAIDPAYRSSTILRARGPDAREVMRLMSDNKLAFFRLTPCVSLEEGVSRTIACSGHRQGGGSWRGRAMNGRPRLLVDVRETGVLRFHALATLYLIAERLRSVELA